MLTLKLKRAYSQVFHYTYTYMKVMKAIILFNRYINVVLKVSRFISLITFTFFFIDKIFIYRFYNTYNIYFLLTKRIIIFFYCDVFLLITYFDDKTNWRNHFIFSLNMYSKKITCISLYMRRTITPIIEIYLTIIEIVCTSQYTDGLSRLINLKCSSYIKNRMFYLRIFQNTII